MPCSAATPATRACVPSPPATPSRSAPRATAWRATWATSTGSGPPIRNTSAPSSSAFRFRSNFSTFPPPDFGFMIRYGCRAGGSAGCSGIRQSAGSPASAPRAVTPASSHTAADTIATHSTPRNAKTTITATGARTNTTSDSQRTIPRRDKNKNAAARLTTAARRTHRQHRQAPQPGKNHQDHDRRSHQHKTQTRQPTLRGRALREPRACSADSPRTSRPPSGQAAGFSVPSTA